jgi:hypothetical protein
VLVFVSVAISFVRFIDALRDEVVDPLLRSVDMIRQITGA